MGDYHNQLNSLKLQDAVFDLAAPSFIFWADRDAA